VSKLSAALKVFAFFPPLLVLVGTIGVIACGKSIYPTVTPTNTSSSTATASPATMAFVSNFNSGTISEFKRNTTTGKLTRVGVVTSGAKKGPKGIAITPANGFLYSANYGDGKIYEYSIGSNAVLTALGNVSDGSGSGPSWIAINPAGTFLYVTNFSNGTMSTWSIGSTGTLTALQTITGFSGPFGLVINSAGSTMYVADNTAGLIYTFTINSGGTLTSNGSVASLGGATGAPGLLAINGTNLYVDDINNGVITLFSVSGTTPVFGGNFPSTFASNIDPIGIEIASPSAATYVMTANQMADNVWSFQIQSSGALTLPPTSSSSVSNPTGLAVDPLSAFAYTADQGDGTVGIFQLNVGCPTTIVPACLIGTIASETSPPADGSAPFDVVLTN